MMYKNIILITIIISIFTGCFSAKNLLVKDELQEYVANQGEIINNLNGSVLSLVTSSDTESLSVVLPKDNLTLRIKLKIPNVEDVLYMNITTDDEFKINKLIRRVSSFDELDLEQDGWVFEPSVEKNVAILQLYLPAIYLYTTQFNPTLNFSYKRSARSLQDSIKFNFIRQNYYVTFDKNGYEVPKYAELDVYCAKTSRAPSENFSNQIELLNTNRVSEEFINTLRGVCQ